MDITKIVIDCDILPSSGTSQHNDKMITVVEVFLSLLEKFEYLELQTDNRSGQSKSDDLIEKVIYVGQTKIKDDANQFLKSIELKIRPALEKLLFKSKMVLELSSSGAASNSKDVVLDKIFEFLEDNEALFVYISDNYDLKIVILDKYLDLNFSLKVRPLNKNSTLVKGVNDRVGKRNDKRDETLQLLEKKDGLYINLHRKVNYLKVEREKEKMKKTIKKELRKNEKYKGVVRAENIL